VLSAEKDVELTELFLFGGIDIDIDLPGFYGGFGGASRRRWGGDSIGNRSRLSRSSVGFWTCCWYGGNRGRGMLVASSLEYAVEERLQPDL
jgi:hypothetical protein